MNHIKGIVGKGRGGVGDSGSYSCHYYPQSCLELKENRVPMPLTKARLIAACYHDD